MKSYGSNVKRLYKNYKINDFYSSKWASCHRWTCNKVKMGPYFSGPSYKSLLQYIFSQYEANMKGFKNSFNKVVEIKIQL